MTRKPTATRLRVHMKHASCNLSSIKLLISVRVELWSLSKLPRLHKIKDARFLCHCLPIERGPLPQCDDLGPLWPTRGQSINAQLERLVRWRLEGIALLESLHAALCWKSPEITQERGGKQLKWAGFLPADVYLTQAQSISVVWDFKLLLLQLYHQSGPTRVVALRWIRRKLDIAGEQCYSCSRVRLPLNCSSLEDNLFGPPAGQAGNTIQLRLEDLWGRN